ncbi:uncharacterized protein LOC127799834 [Diospyros lotus]|uniref:uncharacterized protein LOC127799834 n=1 Tax=Diospyros lotus TaxID=55363 RepID=UPI0022576730|nr:uncharacterized protein LOC127799834 [Diospyros lotus]
MQAAMTPANTLTMDSQTLQITQHKLNGINFREWFQSVTLVIKGKGKFNCLTGIVPTPLEESVEYQLWEVENSIPMAWLINSMEPKIGRTYLFYKTAKEVWDAVQELYSDLKNTAQCFEIKVVIRTTKQSGLSVTEYYNNLVELLQEMDLFYDPKWECSSDSQKYNRMFEKS